MHRWANNFLTLYDTIYTRYVQNAEKDQKKSTNVSTEQKRIAFNTDEETDYITLCIFSNLIYQPLFKDSCDPLDPELEARFSIDQITW